MALREILPLGLFHYQRVQHPVGPGSRDGASLAAYNALIFLSGLAEGTCCRITRTAQCPPGDTPRAIRSAARLSPRGTPRGCPTCRRPLCACLARSCGCLPPSCPASISARTGCLPSALVPNRTLLRRKAEAELVKCLRGEGREPERCLAASQSLVRGLAAFLQSDTNADALLAQEDRIKVWICSHSGNSLAFVSLSWWCCEPRSARLDEPAATASLRSRHSPACPHL